MLRKGLVSSQVLSVSSHLCEMRILLLQPKVGGKIIMSPVAITQTRKTLTIDLKYLTKRQVIRLLMNIKLISDARLAYKKASSGHSQISCNLYL
jgi:hypothetical protein